MLERLWLERGPHKSHLNFVMTSKRFGRRSASILTIDSEIFENSFSGPRKDTNVILHGELRRKLRRKECKTLGRRMVPFYTVLNARTLECYEDLSCWIAGISPALVIVLENITGVFRCQHKRHRTAIDMQVQAPHQPSTVYRFLAPSEKEARDWLYKLLIVAPRILPFVETRHTLFVTSYKDGRSGDDGRNLLSQRSTLFQSSLVYVANIKRFKQHQKLIEELLADTISDFEVLKRIYDLLPPSARPGPLQNNQYSLLETSQQCVVPDCHFQKLSSTKKCLYHKQEADTPELVGKRKWMLAFLNDVDVIPILARVLESRSRVSITKSEGIFAQPFVSSTYSAADAQGTSAKQEHDANLARRLAVVIMWGLCVPHKDCRSRVSPCEKCKLGSESFTAYIATICVRFGNDSWLNSGLGLLLVDKGSLAVAGEESDRLIGGAARSPLAWGPILYALAYSGPKLLVDTLEYINGLLIGHQNNTEVLLSIDGWQALLASAIFHLFIRRRKQASVIDATRGHAFKLAINIFTTGSVQTLVHNQGFCSVVRETLSILSVKGGMDNFSLMAARTYLTSLCIKLESQIFMLPTQYDHAIWKEILEFPDLISLFLLHSPEWGVEPHYFPSFIKHPDLKALPIHSLSFPLRQHIGLHWDRDGTAKDLPFSHRAAALYEALQKRSESLNVDLTREEKRVVNAIRLAAEYFEEVASFLGNISKHSSRSHMHRTIKNFASKRTNFLK